MDSAFLDSSLGNSSQECGAYMVFYAQVHHRAWEKEYEDCYFAEQKAVKLLVSTDTPQNLFIMTLSLGTPTLGVKA